MNNDKFQKAYKETLQKLKQDKLDWDFDDFLAKAETQQDQPVPAIPSARRVRTFYWVAAAALLLFGLYTAFKFLDKPAVNPKDSMVRNEILKQKAIIADSLVAENLAVTDTVKVQKDSLSSEQQAESEANKVMDKILSKRSRMKKQRRQVYVQLQKTPKAGETAPVYENNFVTINGHKIEDEKEAIDVTRYSLQMLSEKVTQTVAKAEPATEYVDF